METAFSEATGTLGGAPARKHRFTDTESVNRLHHGGRPQSWNTIRSEAVAVRYSRPGAGRPAHILRYTKSSQLGLMSRYA